MEATKPGLLKSFLIAVALMAIIIILIIGVTLLKLPTWPFVFFLFGITTLSKLTKEGWVDTTVGGFIGLMVGLSNVIVANYFGATAGMLALVALVIIILTILVNGKFKYTNVPCLFILTVASNFSGITFNQVTSIIISFFIGVALFGVVILIIDAMGNKKAQKAEA